MRMLLINLISEEMFYRITTDCKTAEKINNAFHLCFEGILAETWQDVGGMRKFLNDLERRLLKDDLRRRLFGEDY